MPALNELQAFDIAEATVTLWVFKRSFDAGAPRFRGRWIETTEPLDAVLRETAVTERARIHEVITYGLLAQNNEASALAIEMEKTHAGLVISEATAQTPQKRVKRVEEIRNSIFYVVKFELDDTAIYAVKKVSSSWRTKKSKGIISVIYTDQTLTLDESPAFEISKTIDFFIVGDKVLIINKENFESALSYKQAHEEAFAVLQEEPEFSAIFSDLTPIRDFVGNNKIQLRRALAIGDRGHYKTLAFMSNLRTHSEKYRLAIIFDESGRIVPTADTCRAIFQALLDHRLLSPFSQNIYDVPDAVTVAS